MILGASFDTPQENAEFRQAQSFPFELLSDVDHTVGRAFDVERPAGERSEYPMRHSYLIDPDGIIRRAYDVTDVSGHAAQVLADAGELRRERGD